MFVPRDCHSSIPCFFATTPRKEHVVYNADWLTSTTVTSAYDSYGSAIIDQDHKTRAQW